MASFMSWIPTASGYLSFRFIGESDFPTRCVYARSITESEGTLIGYQKRILNDALLPAFVLRKLTGQETRFWFLCLASWKRKKPDASLQGTIVFFPRSTWKYRVEAIIRNLLATAKNDSYSALVNKIVPCLTLAMCYSNFTLKRNGEVKFEWVGKSGIECNENEQHQIVAQHYFFLRDITHKHQHHAPTTDTIIDVYQCSNSSKSESLNWRRKVLSSLYRSAISLRRHTPELGSAAGILVYARKFVDICRDKFPAFYSKLDLDNLVRSIDVEGKTRAERHDKERQRKSAWLTVTFSVFAIFISFIALLQLKPNAFEDVAPSLFLVEAGKFVLQYPIIVLAVLGLTLGFTPLVGSLHSLHKSGSYLLRLLQPLKKQPVVVLGVGIGAALAYLSIKLALLVGKIELLIANFVVMFWE